LFDFDNDGDLDFHYEDVNWNTGTFTPKRYSNNVGIFTETFSGSIDEMFGVLLMDIDADNDMDFISGLGKVYLNTNGSFSFRSVEISDFLNFFDPPKGDFNNDNKPDAIIVTQDNIRFYPNTNSYFTNPQVISQYSSTMGYYNYFLFDFDNNGSVDLFNAGYERDHSVDETRTRIFKKDNNNFTSSTESENPDLFNIRTQNAAFRDFDMDFDMDLLLADADTLRLFINNNGIFTQSEKWAIPNIEFLKWVDIDSNGFPDVIYATNLRKIQFLLNNGSSYTLSLTTINGNDFRIGDLDNDGDYDMTVNMYFDAYIYNNQLINTPFILNQPPNSPPFLSVTQVADTTFFHWNASIDDTTPQSALTYNLYIGSASGSTDIMSPLSDLATGYRKIVDIGNTDANLGWKIVGLPCGTYYWSVQAIDNAYAGGEFAVEQSFTISCGIEASNFCLGELTTFSASFTNIKSVLWNFGDSQTSTELNPSHIYANAGTYTVTLEVTFTDNSTQTITKTIEILNKPATILIEHE